MKNSVISINFDNHRSRERIKNMGEVFTPEQYALKLLDAVAAKSWSNENTIWFEMTCGHGNIVLPILMKRFETLEKKYSGSNHAALRSLANSLNTLWAIDICPKNVELTRMRVLEFTFHILSQEGFSIDDKKSREYLAHVLCTIHAQIHENEALSALGMLTIIEKRGIMIMRRKTIAI